MADCCSVNALWMGGLDTERARAYLATLPVESQLKMKRESPQFTGKVIAALYESDQRMKLSGRRALIGAELGVSDIDGSAPRSHRYAMGGPPELHATLTSWLTEGTSAQRLWAVARSHRGGIRSRVDRDRHVICRILEAG